MAETGVLLESGTNELEIVEFHISHKDNDGNIVSDHYGVNVAKVKEIIKSPDQLADVPRSHPAISGVINLRGKIIPIIDLPGWLKKDAPDIKCKRVIITMFNKILTGFLVHSVSRIHCVSWQRVEPPSGLMSHTEQDCITGLVKFEEKILMMLDFERIVGEINPEINAYSVSIKKSDKRKGKTVFVAEDSAFTRRVLVDLLKNAGYRVFAATNGVEAMEKLNNVAASALKNNIPIKRYLNLIVTDVEMPQMDGLHMITKLKEHDMLKDIPILVFSSMVTPENRRKWSSLGADAFISKPEIDRLVQIVDSKII